MKRISIIGSQAINIPFDAHNKASYLLRMLQELEYELTTELDGDFLLAIDHNKRDYKKFINQGRTPACCILLRLEPYAVFPAQYGEEIEKSYAKIFSPGMLIPAPPGVPEFGWVYRYDFNPIDLSLSSPPLSEILSMPTLSDSDLIAEWGKRNIYISMITGNKVSPTKDSNYPLRRSIIRGLASDRLEVYGTLWTDSFLTKLRDRLAVCYFSIRNNTFPNLRSVFAGLLGSYPNIIGPVDNKHLILKDSKFSITLENSNTYVSEKLFDAIINRTIPIYVGPNLSSVGLPPEIAIHSNGNPVEILRGLEVIDANSILEILKAGQKFIRSEEFMNNWTEVSVYKKIALEISAIFKTS